MKKYIVFIGKKIAKYKHIDSVVLFAALSGYIALSISTISKWSIWFDEAFSAYIVRFDALQIAQFTASDVHPPLYYWVLKGWTMLFGTSELAFRSLSLLFGIVCIVLLFALIRKYFGKKAAMITVVFVALSPMMLRMGQETRMYTMVAAIGLAATWALLKAEVSKGKKWWVTYGLLVAAGMWTHYFSALIWITHWVWRLIRLRMEGVKGKLLVGRFFSKQWILVHIFAIAIFAPWLPFMIQQLTGIQGSGFWIGPVTADSITNVVTTTFLYMQHDYTAGWPSVLFYLLVVGGIVAASIAYKTIKKENKPIFILLISLVVVPITVAIIASMPPLKSSFIERYFFISLVMIVVVYAVSIAAIYHKHRIFAVLLSLLVVGSLVFGIHNAQYYGNFNKSTNTSITTKPLLEEIHEKSAYGQPIISLSPWIFYEAAPYETTDFPIYYLNDSVEGSEIGSLAMLQRENSHNIIDLTEFSKSNSVVWVIDAPYENSIKPPIDSWVELQSFRLNDIVTGGKRYQAVQYQTQ